MYREHRITSGRAILAAQVTGHGHPVVFLHANVCDSRMWRDQMDAAGSGNEAIAYDRRGFGKTHAEPEEFSSVADLMAVLDAVAEGRPAILVGCSQGGKVALDAVLQHPTRVRGLFLVAPSVGGAPEPVPARDQGSTRSPGGRGGCGRSRPGERDQGASLARWPPRARGEDHREGPAAVPRHERHRTPVTSGGVESRHRTCLRSPARGARPLARDLGQLRFPAVPSRKWWNRVVA